MIDLEAGALSDILVRVGRRARELRLVRGFRQEELALRAGVGVATVVRFERSGRASIENVLRLAFALGAESGFERLFEAPPFASLDDALTRPERTRRQRGPRRRTS